MTLTLEIAPEVERVLEEKARRRGMALAAYLLDLAHRDAAPENEIESQANNLWAELTNDRTHNDAIIALARAPEAVRAIVMRRSVDDAAAFYASPAGHSESEEMEDWRALEGQPFQTEDEVETEESVR
ncbi:MAG TPA: hypothetical protein VFJ58_00185 [Armatimonadota bacterium]|nr:hypothetical protein [Armatimonadota bacterium]